LGAPVELMSKPFAPPTTGRLLMSVHLKTPEKNRKPAVELVIRGKLQGKPFSRVGFLGPNVEGQGIHDKWWRFDFPIEDLPLEGLSDMQVGLRLVGRGEIWVDDVVLRHLEFDGKELLRLSLMIDAGNAKLDQNQFSDCIHLLEGYWPRYLEQNVPLPPNMARRPAPKPESERKPKKEEARTGLLDRMRGLVPRKLW
jgi:hypothetical protein